MLRLTDHYGLQGLEALRDEWLALLAERSEWQPFERPEFYAAICATGLGGEQPLRFVAVREAGRLVAVWPLALYGPRWPWRPWSHWSLPVHDHLPLASPCFAHDARLPDMLGELVEHLVATGRGDRLELPALLRGSSGLATAGCGNAARVDCRQSACHELHYTAAAEALQLSLPKSLRRSLDRAEARLNALGPVTFTFGESANLEEALADFLAIEDSGWKHDEGTSIACSPQLRHFYHHLALEFAATGLLRINRLAVGSRVVAAQFALLGSDRLFVLKSGYDESLREAAPGNLLRMGALRHGLELGSYATLNLAGAPAWSETWAPVNVETSHLTICLPNAAGRLSALAIAAKSRARQLRSALPRFHKGAH